MIYAPPEELKRVRGFAKDVRKTVSSVVREGILMRIAAEKNPFEEGFERGLSLAMDVAKTCKGGSMKFPSGKSFGELVAEELEKYRISRPKQEEQE